MPERKKRPTQFGFLKMMILFFQFFTGTFGCPLAEFYQHSAEASTLESYCDFRSGVILKMPCDQCDERWPTPFRRVGEARHPGPLSAQIREEDATRLDACSMVRFGTSNPGGLRNKEGLAIDLAGASVKHICPRSPREPVRDNFADWLVRCTDRSEPMLANLHNNVAIVIGLEAGVVCLLAQTFHRNA